MNMLTSPKTPAPQAEQKAPAGTAGPDLGLELFKPIQKVPLTLSAELDHRSISVRDLLGIRMGSILELSKSAGENVTLYAGDVLLGSGEVLVIDATLAIRVADIRDKPLEAVSDPEQAVEVEP